MAVCKSSRLSLKLDELPAPILTLNVDCCEEMFEYLSLCDLYALSQTCRPLRKVVGDYFMANYASVDTELIENNAILVWPQALSRNNPVKMENFNEFISKLMINLNRSDYREINPDYFTSLNQLIFKGGEINTENIQYFRKILFNIKMLNIECVKIDEPYDSLLKYCKNLKHLCIFVTEKQINLRNNWLTQTYRCLEHLELKSDPIYQNDGFYGFLDRHRYLKTFITNANFFWSHRYHFLHSKAKLDLFQIEFSNHQNEDVWSVFKQLYANGFYKRLHFHVYAIDKKMEKNITLIPNIELLYIASFEKKIPLPKIDKLKMLHISICQYPFKIELIENIFENIEEVFIGHAPIDYVMAFITNAPKLIKFKIELIPDLEQTDNDENQFNGGNLDIEKLNKKRGQLNGARKVTIFVPDNIFIPTKRAAKFGEIRLKYVDMQRTYRFPWNDHPF